MVSVKKRKKRGGYVVVVVAEEGVDHCHHHEGGEGHLEVVAVEVDKEEVVVVPTQVVVV